MITGKQIRDAIRARDYTMEEAADLLGVTRQTLYSITNKGEVSADVAQNIITKLQLSLQSPDNAMTGIEQESSATETIQEKYIAILERNLHEKEEEIKRLNNIVSTLSEIKETAERNEASLETVQSNQALIMDWTLALIKALSEFLPAPAGLGNLLETSSRIFVQDRKAKNQKGNNHNMGKEHSRSDQ